MTDNYEIIRPLLRFPTTYSFYFLEIIKRRKENPEMLSHAKLVRDYYIYSLAEFDKLRLIIEALCDENNARAYFRLNRREADRIALQYNKRLAELLITQDYKAIPRSYAAVVGEFHHDENKTWVVDVDGEEVLRADEICTFIDSLEPRLVTESPNDPRPTKIVARIPTKNGLHLITNPFRLDQFKKEFPSIDSHKDNPTILYMP